MKEKTGFENIIDLKSSLLDRESSILAGINTEISESLNKINTCEKKLVNLKPDLDSVVSSMDLEMISAGRLSLENQRKKLIEVLENLEESKKRQMEKLTMLHQELSGLKKIHEKKATELQKAATKKQEREVDDIFSSRRNEK
ncbi:flagellar FliJ family protein [Myxococcota bacterium]|nr:flagellar FliJ family protein [Myxococcota bacterium]MBU1380652.1 flagellar FliJ family protein [Myxococcota bacterium]MBU1495739.1 flagellar FliJ family protein [Myxococcota bacterium]